jgi:hypothetical protein
MYHQFNLRKTKLFFLISFCLATANAFSQNLDYNSKITITLNDGTPVTLYAQTEGFGMNARAGKNYYYLPTQVKLAKSPQTQVPEFLFLKYVTEEREDQGGVSGALLHFLMQLAFSQDQLNELQNKLDQKISGAKVKGSVDLFAAPEANSFYITSATVNKEGGMAKSVATSGKAPLQQGGRVAVAANLNKHGAQLIAATFENMNTISDVSVTLLYKYYLKVNGLKGKITIDYEKIAKLVKEDKVTAEYRRVESKNSVQESQSWKELHKVYDKMVEKNAITIQLDQGIPSALGDKLTEMFFQLFIDKLATTRY